MCNCKKSKCSTRVCPCLKGGRHCGKDCGCKNCTNHPPEVKQEGLPLEVKQEGTNLPPEVKQEESDEVFQFPLKIMSWNLCHFSSFRGSLEKRTQAAFTHIRTVERPDIMVLQEFPKTDASTRIDQLRRWMGEEYEVTVSEVSHTEHVFMWKKATIRPLKPKLDDYIREFLSGKLKRSAGTMRFEEIQTKMVCIVTSVHLVSGGGNDTQEELESVFGEYRAGIDARYGKEFLPGGDALHIVMGDFNLNPHHLKKQAGWTPTGDLKTRTSSGSKGYDFFFLDDWSNAKFRMFQQELVQKRPKNSCLSLPGISDHDPICLTLWKYRA